MNAVFLAAAVVVIGVGACASGETPASPSGTAPQLTALSPSSGPRGTAVTLTGSGFAAEGNALKFGSGYLKKLHSADGRTIRFTVPDAVDVCPTPNEAALCPAMVVVPGKYAVVAISADGNSNELEFTVLAQ